MNLTSKYLGALVTASAPNKDIQMKMLIMFVTSVIILSIGSSDAMAQRGRGGGAGWGSGSAYGRMYNTNTVETIRGEVVKVERFTPIKGMGNGVHLLVRTNQDEISVHLGPAWFINNQEIEIQPKDQLEITGSKITFEGKPAIIAAEVKKGDQVLVLRDSTGRPYWAGWRRGGAASK